MSQHRQRILLGLLAAVGLYFAGDWAWQKFIEAPKLARANTAAQIQRQIDQRLDVLRRARTERAYLAAWEAASLPAHPEVARSLYQNWLLELIDHVGFTGPSVNAGQPASRQGLYLAIPFTVRVRGTLAQLTQFLFEFYNAGHLHQLRSLAITPIPQTGQLDLSLAIEGLIVPSTPRRDQLAAGRINRLAFASLDDYRVVAQRNFFSAGGDAVDPTDHTFLTGVNYVDGRPQAWFTLRAQDKVLRLGLGDRLEVGQFQGAIAEIDDSDVIVESEGQHWLLTVGDSVADAFALPPER